MSVPKLIDYVKKAERQAKSRVERQPERQAERQSERFQIYSDGNVDVAIPVRYSELFEKVWSPSADIVTIAKKFKGYSLGKDTKPKQ